jgi:hypothetical protein
MPEEHPVTMMLGGIAAFEEGMAVSCTNLRVFPIFIPSTSRASHETRRRGRLLNPDHT